MILLILNLSNKAELLNVQDYIKNKVSYLWIAYHYELFIKLN